MINLKEIDKSNEKWRNESINLIASENVISPKVRDLLNNSFWSRYSEGMPGNKFYQGQKHIEILEIELEKLLKKAFGAKYVDFRPISGTVGNLACYNMLIKPYANVYVNSVKNSGHISHNDGGMLGIMKANMYSFPIQKVNPFKCDVEELKKQLHRINESLYRGKTDLLVFGKSVFMYKEPITEIKKEFPKITIMADYSHVLGLWNQFQNPLLDGADICVASTHKTFPGIEGAVILSNKPINRNAIFPGVVSSHHIGRLLCMIQATREFIKYGNCYAKDTIKNAQELQRELYLHGFDTIINPFEEPTETHQIVIDVSKYGGGAKIAKLLEDNNIITNKNLIWKDSMSKEGVDNPSGIRLGTQEMTRMGMRIEDMKYIAYLMQQIIMNRKNMKKEVIEFRKKFQEIFYCD